ncbi:MAG: DUF3108 domain-containing protein [Nitrosomonadales bacterium]|nr:DUF3108 domain-containing protein [Nitrosomonadales bacterium]
MGSGTPDRRIALAVALSALIHAAIMWLPQVHLPHTEILLPPLTAKLEPLPKPAAKPLPKPAPKPRRASPSKLATKPASRVKEPNNTIAGTPEPASLPAIEAVPDIAAASAVEAVSAVAAVSAEEAQPAATMVEEPEAAYPLPRHAQLAFSVYKGLDNFQIGTLNQQLEISGDEYTLKAVTKTMGLAKLFKNYQLTQTSHGKSGKQGLQPETFEEEKINDNDKQNIKATFDWMSQKLLFSQGGETALPAGAQDMLSIFYHLSQLPMNREIIPLAVSNGKKLEKYELGVGPEEEIITPMGKLRALHLRKLHAKGESGFEIWLGLEYRLLPVKYLLIEPSDEVAGEIVITSIRTAD